MTTTWNDLASLEKESSTSFNNLLLVDGNNIAFRYLKSQQYNNFTESYIDLVKSLAKSYEAKRIICCFDIGKSNFRKQIFENYKKREEKTPEEQLHFEEFFKCLHYTMSVLPFEHYKFKGVEADDVITFLTNNLKQHYEHIWIVSSDKDLYQLLDSNISIFNLFSRKEITIDSLFDEHKISPEQFMFSRIIQGDTSDKIDGIEGIGPIRGIDLIKTYESIENLVNSLPIVKTKLPMYLKNLNEGKEKIIRNEKLMSLKKYNKEVINCAENPIGVWHELNNAIQF